MVSHGIRWTRGVPLVARRTHGGSNESMSLVANQQTPNWTLPRTLVRRICVRGGNVKWRALRLNTGNYSWGSEVVIRKTHILDVVYNASNNELVKTQTLVNSAIIQVDAAPFKLWYLTHYGVEIGKKKKAAAKKYEAENGRRDKALQQKLRRAVMFRER